jgi:hypothetical protein
MNCAGREPATQVIFPACHIRATASGISRRLAEFGLNPRGSLDRGAKLLEQIPKSDHPENHFAFDHAKWIFYAADCYT